MSPLDYLLITAFSVFVALLVACLLILFVKRTWTARSCFGVLVFLMLAGALELFLWGRMVIMEHGNPISHYIDFIRTTDFRYKSDIFSFLWNLWIALTPLILVCTAVTMNSTHRVYWTIRKETGDLRTRG